MAGNDVPQYGKLSEWLARRNEDRLLLGFLRIRDILNFPLPYSARHRFWFWECTDRSPLARAIVDAGWLTIRVDFGKEDVTLQRDAVDPPRLCALCMAEAAKGSLYCGKHPPTC